MAESYGRILRVEHEPLGFDYLPRRLFNRPTLAGHPTAARIGEHFDMIEETLRTRSYLEAGWPAYGAIPHLANRFPGQVKIIHLTRHPVPTAWSLMTHHLYHVPARRDQVDEKALLTPFDSGVSLAAPYRDRWDTLTPFERCLYYWAEINALGLGWRQALAVPWLHLSYEGIFWGDGLARLVEFLDLEASPELLAARNTVTDGYRFRSLANVDPAIIARHPAIVAIARHMGYDPLRYDSDSLKRRYVGPSAYIRTPPPREAPADGDTAAPERPHKAGKELP